MNSREHEALATIGLLAAQADGRQDPDEQARSSPPRSQSFGIAGVGSVHAHVALGTASLEDEAHALASPELRAAAWELAVGVCRADGAVVEKERAFLERLRVALALPPAAMAAADAPLPHALLPAPAARVEAAFTEPAGAVIPDEAALDETIRQAAVLAAALELLPQGLATLGILPVQLKLVADIGAAHGHRIDAGHAKELLATVGLGLGGQAIEGFARRALGRLAGRFGGSLVGGLRRRRDRGGRDVRGDLGDRPGGEELVRQRADARPGRRAGALRARPRGRPRRVRAAAGCGRAESA